MNTRRTLAALAVLCIGMSGLLAGARDAAGPHAAVLRIDGPIGPAVSGYIEKAHRRAVERGARAVVLEIDTPGGLDGAMRDIVQVIMGSPVPVIAWVSPQGAHAASAGTYIVYAAHVAAMAPATSLGAATPVPLAGDAPALPRPGKAPDTGANGKPEASGSPDDRQPAGDGADDEAASGQPSADPATAMQRKVLNDAVAFIRSLAEERGRNADWAELAVREGATLTATEAVERNVVDFIARDLDELLARADGRRVRVSSGEVVVKTAGLAVQRIDPDWRDELLAVITNPTIAYLLLIIGVYGLLLEGYNPGAILPGTVGAICLLLGLFALQVLPVNYVGLGLMLLGITLLIGEAFVPSFGVLGIGGTVAFVFGSVMLMDSDVPGFGVNVGVIGGMALSAVILVVITVVLLRRSRQVAVVTGDATLVGRRVEVGEDGWAQVDGEWWRVRDVRGQVPAPGTRARVAALDGLTLVVEPEADDGATDNERSMGE